MVAARPTSAPKVPRSSKPAAFASRAGKRAASPSRAGKRAAFPSRAGKRAPKGLDKTALLDAAFEMLAAEGEAGFSVRKLAAKAGVDPMTVLHHFGSKDALMRTLADRALSTVDLPPSTNDWQSDLRVVAGAYRDLAHRYPRIFHLHFRFHATGPADHATSEVVYRAMRLAGLTDAQAAGLGLAFYAFVLGCGLAETEGLLQPLSKAEETELMALDPAQCPATVALIPAFKTLNSSEAYGVAVDAFIAGIGLKGAPSIQCPAAAVKTPNPKGIS